MRTLTSLLMASAMLVQPVLAADVVGPSEDWSCSCLTYDGGTDTCYMSATITGRTMWFGAFETSGEGPYKVSRFGGKTTVAGDLRTAVTNQTMMVTIVVPDDGTPASVFLSADTTPGTETFTAQCEGTLP